MLDDFNTENQEPLDTEETSLAWNKKVVLSCLAIASVGMFIFFTSGSWSANDRSDHSSDLLQEIESLKSRLSLLEDNAQPLAAHPTSQPVTEPPTEQPTIASLKSLIEQELQQNISQETTEPQKVSSKQKKYTVKSGDNLSKISQQFYGSAKKWRKIVDANKEVLGHNNMLKPGMKLVIPMDA